jgi:hypothetical protein
MLVTIQLRRGTTSEWSSADPVLAVGEPGLDSTVNRIKTGDGVSTWTNLPWTGEPIVYVTTFADPTDDPNYAGLPDGTVIVII